MVRDPTDPSPAFVFPSGGSSCLPGCQSVAARRRQAKADDGFARETFTQPLEDARQTARAFLDRWPAAAYMTAVESWRELPGGEIEFTMKRLRSGLNEGFPELGAPNPWEMAARTEL